ARTVLAKREVVVSAGTIGSPRLLMLSGIGPAQHLTDHSIPVLVDLPGVGSNLQDHPAVVGLSWTVKPGSASRLLDLINPAHIRNYIQNRQVLPAVFWAYKGEGWVQHFTSVGSTKEPRDCTAEVWRPSRVPSH
ncbi:hypothetical protein OTU49_010504, partial [Cherax quadricarinatus]